MKMIYGISLGASVAVDIAMEESFIDEMYHEIKRNLLNIVFIGMSRSGMEKQL